MTHRTDNETPIERALAHLAAALPLALLSVLAIAAVTTLWGPIPPVAKARQPASPAASPALPIALSDAPAAVTPQPDYRLALLSSSVKLEGDRATFEGLVENLTDLPVHGLLAVVTLYGPDNLPIAARDALVDRDPLPPGESCSWRVTAKLTTETSRSSVEFRGWHVGSFSTRDDRKS